MALSRLLTASGLALVVCLLATPLAARLARGLGVLDRPGHLKPHAQPVPYFGGLGVLAGLAAGSLLLAPPVAYRALGPLVLALGLGLLDDVVTVGVAPRLGGELVVGALVAWAVGPTSAVQAAVVVLSPVVMINAMNFVDGIDGLAAGVSTAAGVGFTFVSDGRWAVFAASVAGASLGFLAFNRPPARVYLGDAGSYLLGTSLTLLAWAHIGQDDDVRAVIVVLALVVVPLAELASTVVRRLLHHRPLFAGDRDHLYDRLAQRGLPPAAVAVLLVGVQVLLAVLATREGAGWTAVLAVAFGCVAAGSLAVALLPAHG